MDDDEYTNDNIILFIYSQGHDRKELTKIKKNKYISEMKLLKEYKIGDNTHFIFSLTLKNDYNKELIELEFKKDDILYSSKVEIKDIYSEIFLFKIDFNPKQEGKNKLTKFTMDYLEQFQLFFNLQKDKSLYIDFSDEYIKNLCLSGIYFISYTEDLLKFDFLFNIFINSYLIQKKENNSKENLMRLFFDSLNIELISSNITEKNEDNLKYKEYFSNVIDIQKEIVELGGKENIDKINIFLSYYYLTNLPDKFVDLFFLNNDYSKNMLQNLQNHRKIFNNFSSEIINFTLLNKAGNINQIENLLELLPNMVELFKEFLDKEIFFTISNLYKIEEKQINALEIMSPKNTDDFDNLYNIFFSVIKKCKNEKTIPFKLPDKFFLDYASFYTNKHLHNLKLIKEMYKEYSSLTEANNTIEIITSLDNLYYEAGIQLIKDDKNFKNDEIINFFKESEIKEIKNIGLYDAYKLINLNFASEEFINNFLNNNFKNFDLKVFLGEQFDNFIQKIFENFKESSDFSNIKNWKISQNVNGNVLKYCIRRISIVLSQDKNMKSSFTDLINFLCNLFSFGSLKIDGFIEEIKDVENKIPSNSLIKVYIRILHKGENFYPISNIFNRHLINYIKNNSGNGPLSIWYRLVIEESNERLEFLYKNLKPEFAVKKEHFLDYPENIQETISLYTYLYNEKYFSYNYITELDYYKNSINAKKELINLTYEQAETILDKYKQYYKLFKLFIPIKRYNEKIYNSEFNEYYKKLKHYKDDHDSLINLIDYYKQFFSESKNIEIASLQNLINVINKSPLTEFYSKKDIINEYLKNAEIANNRIQLTNSIIFMGIYNYKKGKFKEKKEEEIFNNSLEQFKELRNIENLDTFNEELLKVIKESFKENFNKIMEEIDFIFSYFGLLEDYKKKVEIRMKFEKLVLFIPSPPIFILEHFLKEVKNSIYFYYKYRNEDLIIDKLKFFFELIFKIDNQRIVENSKDAQFLYIIKRILIVSLIIFNDKNRLYKNDTNYLFKEFNAIYEVIIEFYEKYSSLFYPINKTEIIESLNNDKIVNFFQEEVSKSIDLDSVYEEFINNFLNNIFKFDFEQFFGKKFDYFIQKIFENFKTPEDFLNIKIWKISRNINEEVLKLFIGRISNVLFQHKNMKSSFNDLINFLCRLFSFGSRKTDDFFEELKEVEKNIPSNKLIEIYFIILNKREKIFTISNIIKRHLFKYIEINSGSGPLSVWYKLVLEESDERLAYLYKNLKPEYAVRKEDFIDYPNKIQESIYLFTNLYLGKYFSYKYITELDYYKNSINAKEELINLTFKQAEQIFKKYNQYYKLFKLFIPINKYNEKNYNSEFTEFYKKLNHYKNVHDSLKVINNYYQQFFSETRNTEIICLKNLIDSINNSPLTEFYSKRDIINDYMRNIEIAKKRIVLTNSIIFMGIYNDKKSKFKKRQEEEIFNISFEKFIELMN